MKAHCTAYEKKILTKEKYILTKTKIRERKSIRVMVQSPNHDLVTEEGSSGENLLATTSSLLQLFCRCQSSYEDFYDIKFVTTFYYTTYLGCNSVSL